LAKRELGGDEHDIEVQSFSGGQEPIPAGKRQQLSEDEGIRGKATSFEEIGEKIRGTWGNRGYLYRRWVLQVSGHNKT